MPSGVFKPYAGVSTAILFFTRGGTTQRTWFYDMEHDGFSLDDKRQRVPENDIPDILTCWRNRHNPIFQSERERRLADLRTQLAPLKATHLQLQAEINRLTFESVIATEDDTNIHEELEAVQRKDAEFSSQIHPLQNEINQLNRQFWVTKEQIRANNYDLSASRYRQLEQDEAYYEKPEVTVERLLRLEKVVFEEIEDLKRVLG
jgi:type I restriction enzyme M protein